MKHPLFSETETDLIITQFFVWNVFLVKLLFHPSSYTHHFLFEGLAVWWSLTQLSECERRVTRWTSSTSSLQGRNGVTQSPHRHTQPWSESTVRTITPLYCFYCKPETGFQDSRHQQHGSCVSVMAATTWQGQNTQISYRNISSFVLSVLLPIVQKCTLAAR